MLITFKRLILELTRQYNMRCAHCMRGEPEDKTIGTSILERLFREVRHIEHLGLTGGEPAAYWMFQTIYGGSTSAKLFLNVREKKSLCYYASAQFVASKGLMIVNSGIENGNFEVARDEILHQLDLCRKGEITDAELESARKTLVNGWRTMLDDPLTLERYWMGQAAAGTLVSHEERIEQVTDITREQVIAAAQSTALDTVFFMKGAAK